METIEQPGIEFRDQCLIKMPLGLLGLEQYKAFVLFSNPADEPFLWLQVVDDPKLAFLVMSPFGVAPAYQPELSDEDVDFLGLQGPEDTLMFNIVTVRAPRQATLNLKGPIVVNRRTLVAKQIIPVNAADLAVAHPLPLQDD